MKYDLKFKIVVLALGLSIVVENTQAQRRRSGYSSGYGSYNNVPQRNAIKKKTNTKGASGDSTKSGYSNIPASSYGTPASSYGNNATSNVNVAPANFGPIDSTLPISVMKPASGGLLDESGPSLRNDAPYEQTYLSAATPLAYQNVREDDLTFKARVWRIIDTREKMNRRFNAGGESNSGQQFINILLKAIRDSGVVAFKDERFTTPMDFQKVMSSFGGGADTSKVLGEHGELTGYKVSPKYISPDSIYRYAVKEDWFFDRNTSRMYVRIIGIAPIMDYTLSNGVSLGDHELFWLYYPDLRPSLVTSVAYNPYNPGDKTTWEAIFEGREFASYITKTDLNNPSNLTFKQYIKDPMFRLYEGEKVKDKIFDYEQALWSY